MGNCLDVPEPKHRRRDKLRGYSATADPIAVAAPPDVMAGNSMAHNLFYPFNPDPHPYYYQFVPLQTATDHVILVDPTTGQKFLVESPYQNHPYNADFAVPSVYYSNMANGVKPKPSRRPWDSQEVNEADNREARALRKKSREERKSSQGHDNDKVDIRDAASFTTTAIVTTTTSTAAPATTSTTSYHAEHVPTGPSETSEFEAVAFVSSCMASTSMATTSTTSYHTEHMPASPPQTSKFEAVSSVSRHDNGKADIRDAASFTTTEIVTATTSTEVATTSTTSYHTEHMPASPPETSKFEAVSFVSKAYIPTPPPTPPSGPADEVDENRHNELVDNPPHVDNTDFSMTHPVKVSFDEQTSHIIPQSEFKMAEEKPDDVQEDELPEVVTSQGVQPQIVFFKPGTCVDVVITYSILGRLESDIVRRLSSLLESSGISVWAERLGDSSRARKSDKTAKAILGSKVVVVILSEGSCDQRFIRDHVALATVINAPIYPVTTQQPREVIDAMPVELRLQLKYDPEEWTEIGTNIEESLLFNLRSLARSVQEDVEYLREKENAGHAKPMVRRTSRRRSMSHNLKAASFWDVHFGHRYSVKWERMQKTIEEEFNQQLKRLVDDQSQPLVLAGLKKKVCDDQHPDTIKKDTFTAVCTQDGENIDVWEAILKVARTEQAVRDIFDAESTVRHLVLEHAESLGRQSVIEILCQLLADSDANVRVMSVVSLSTCMHADDTKALELVLSTLSDDDRLVREAACIALGNLKLHSAVSKLIHVWRNDVISHVRAAAFLSLSQIGGKDVEEAMRLTAVLSDEIRDLTLEDVQ